ALKNVWVVSAIEAICEALVQMGIRGADAEVFDRGILSRSELIKIITYDLLLNGNAYLLKTDVAGKLALVPLEPTRVRIQINEQIKVSYNDTPINYDELIHIRNVIPNESGNERFLLGDSVIKQIIDIIILDNKIVQLNIANVSTNNLTLIASFKEFVDESVLKRLESHIKRELEQNKKLQFLISPVPMDVKEIQTNSEMLYIQTQRENAIKILSVFRIP
ncbi:MAG: phage portal protein, partial [Spirochaetia bacterium]|nr:phage portal protein [Spirochaetota bacterium]MDW8113302.1 phage portal protein [Spirochaetia bacterium]